MAPRAVLLSLEWLGPVVSGNGVYARSLARALLAAGLPTLVVSGRREDAPVAAQVATDAALAALLDTCAAVGGGSGVVDVPLPAASWGRLDHTSGWREFAAAAAESTVVSAVAAFAPTVMFAVDWSGVVAADRLAAALPAPASSCPIVWLNFRVYASSGGLHAPAAPSPHASASSGGLHAPAAPSPDAPATAGHPASASLTRLLALPAAGVEGADPGPAAFYRAMERACLHRCASTVALCRQDAAALLCIAGALVAGSSSVVARDGAGDGVGSAPRGATGSPHMAVGIDPMTGAAVDAETGVHLTLPQLLAAGGTGHAASGAVVPLAPVPLPRLRILLPPLRGDMARLATEDGVSSSERPSGASTAASSLGAWLASLSPIVWPDPFPPGARFLTCAVRLSTEKAPHRFAAALEQPGLQAALAARGIVPFLCGAPVNAAYAEEVHGSLRRVHASGRVGCVVVTAFMTGPTMARLWQHTVLNCHPPDADAYGMTVVEAAAFGAPTLVHAPPSRQRGPASETGEGPPSAVAVLSAAAFAPIAADSAGSHSTVPSAAGFVAVTRPLGADGGGAAVEAALATVDSGEEARRRAAAALPAYPPVGACDLLHPVARVAVVAEGDAASPAAVGDEASLSPAPTLRVRVHAEDGGGPAALAQPCAFVTDWSAPPSVVAAAIAAVLALDDGAAADATAVSLRQVAAAARRTALAWLESGSAGAMAALAREVGSA
jgi:hypothetical protein